MSNSPPSPGPDLHFAAGECLTRFGVWVRRTDMDLEEATRETASRASDATAVGRDGIIRTWEVDAPRGEWLNQADIEALRNLVPNSNIKTWEIVSNCVIDQLTDTERLFLVADPGATLSFCRPDTFVVPDGSDVRCSIDIRKNADARTVSFRLAGTTNAGIFLDPRNGTITLLAGTVDATATLTLDNYWRLEFTHTVTDGSGVQMQLYPAFSNQGDLSGVSDATATGNIEVRGPQCEFGTETTRFQATPLDTDRKFPSLLLEDASTNGWTFSEDLDNGTWTKSNATVSPDVLRAPDNAITMDKLVEDVSFAIGHFVTRNTPAISDNTQQAVSVYAVAEERIYLCVRTIDKSDTVRASWINLATGKVETTDPGHTVKIRELPGSRFRVEVSFDSSAGATTPVVQFRLADADNVLTYDGDGVSGLYLWGMQFEADERFPSSYISTGGATATRAFDQFVSTFHTPPIEMTAYVKFVESGSVFDASNTRIFSIGGIGQANAPRLHLSTSGGEYRFLHESDTGTALSTLTTPPDQGDLVEHRAILFADGSVDVAQTINGGAEEFGGRTAAIGLAPSWFGSAQSNLFLNSSGVSVIGFVRLLAVKFHRGVQDRAFMRRL